MRTKMQMPVDCNNRAIQCLEIKNATDYSGNNTIPAGEGRVIRVTAIEDCRLWSYSTEKTGEGLLLPAGCTEYFYVPEGDIIEISGNCNIAG